MTNYEKVSVYIEIEKFSNQKYEFNKKTNMLELDRVLPYPYFYPYAYGFIPNTLAQDGDELDALIITNKQLKNNSHYEAYIIGVLVMEDEKGMDEKILCILEEDLTNITDILNVNDSTRYNLDWFFSNYKTTTPNKWSKVHCFENRIFANNLYRSSIITPSNYTSKNILSEGTLE